MRRQIGMSTAAGSCTQDRLSRNLQLGLEPAAVGQDFRDLHRIERRALAQIVRDAPEVEPFLDRRVLADAGNIGRVLARRLVRSDVAAGLAPVDDEAARRLATGCRAPLRR